MQALDDEWTTGAAHGNRQVTCLIDQHVGRRGGQQSAFPVRRYIPETGYGRNPGAGQRAAGKAQCIGEVGIGCRQAVQIIGVEHAGQTVQRRAGQYGVARAGTQRGAVARNDFKVSAERDGAADLDLVLLRNGCAQQIGFQRTGCGLYEIALDGQDASCACAAWLQEASVGQCAGADIDGAVPGDDAVVEQVGTGWE